jgi:hypothetical protein
LLRNAFRWRTGSPDLLIFTEAPLYSFSPSGSDLVLLQDVKRNRMTQKKMLRCLNAIMVPGFVSLVVAAAVRVLSGVVRVPVVLF